MKKRFNADGLRFELANTWDGVTMEQFLKLSEDDVDLSPEFLITTLSGIDSSEFRKLRCYDLNAVVVDHLQFINTKPEVPNAPLSIDIDGKTVKLPVDIGAVSDVGQMWDVDSEIRYRQKSEEPTDPAALAYLLLPVFMWPLLRSEPYTDHHQATEELWPMLSKLPCTQALSLSAFFLTSFLRPTSSGRISVEGQPMQIMKWQQRLRLAWMRMINTLRRSALLS